MLKIVFLGTLHSSALYSHYSELKDVKSEPSSRGSNQRPCVPSKDLWLHLQATILASLFRLFQCPGKVAE